MGGWQGSAVLEALSSPLRWNHPGPSRIRQTGAGNLAAATRRGNSPIAASISPRVEFQGDSLQIDL